MIFLLSMGINPDLVRRQADRWYNRLARNYAPEYVAVQMGEITEEDIKIQGIVSILLGTLRDEQRQAGKLPDNKKIGAELAEILRETFGLDPEQVYLTMEHIRTTLPRYRQVPEA